MAESKIPERARDGDKQFKDRWGGVRKKKTDLHMLFGAKIYTQVELPSGEVYIYQTAGFIPNLNCVTAV